MYTKKRPNKKVSVEKYFHYFSLTIITMLSIIMCCGFISEDSETEVFYDEVYAKAINESFTETPLIVIENTSEKAKEKSTDYSSMTKSEIKEHQKTLKQQIDSWEENKNNDLSRSDLVKEYEKSEKVLEAGSYLYPYSQNDLNIVAYVIHREAGSYWLSERHRDLVGCVFLNRKNQGGINQDLHNPTFADILNEEGQYPYKSWNVDASVIEDYCWESAVRVLEHKVDCPDSVVWQATFKQGSGVYEKFYDKTLNTTTYICFR